MGQEVDTHLICDLGLGEEFLFDSHDQNSKRIVGKTNSAVLTDRAHNFNDVDLARVWVVKGVALNNRDSQVFG